MVLRLKSRSEGLESRFQRNAGRARSPMSLRRRYLIARDLAHVAWLRVRHGNLAGNGAL